MSTTETMTMAATAEALNPSRSHKDALYTFSYSDSKPSSYGNLWSPRSARLETAYRLLDSYSKLSPQALLANFDASFSYQTLPSSLGLPIRDLDAFGAHAGFITGIFSTFAMVPIAIFEDPVKNAVIATCDMVGHLKSEIVGGDGMKWRNECMLVLKMTADGRRIVSMKEFVDSAKGAELKALLMAKKDEGGANDGRNPMEE